ncbi:hypothetical protein ACFWWT_42430 [Streptomyces sp. NPDC058676]|uniref:hypothetical protein n=1 Tax=unclassified Streptomyces TaxID=2593676 RepID=UPI00364DD09F
MTELAGTLVSGAFIAVLAAWLTNRCRNRQEQQTEIGALRVQADALPVALAVAELQGAAAATACCGKARLNGHGRSCWPYSPSPEARPGPGSLAARTG